MKQSISIIGGGNMGSAIISGIRKDCAVVVCESDSKRANALKKKFKVRLAGLKEAVSQSSVVILAVKPQNFEEVLSQAAEYITAKHLVVSIAAGITTLYIEKRLGTGVRVVRTMPNLPAQVGCGITAICKGKFATSADVKLASQIFNSIGETIVLDEKWIDSVTAVSGSGPAYVFLFVECFLKAAKALGLKEDVSQKLVKQTLRGSLSLLESQKEDAHVLRERVTSKGGTTQAALDIFFRNKIDKIFIQALRAARNRAKELSK